jgi:hypothetical protein
MLLHKKFHTEKHNFPLIETEKKTGYCAGKNNKQLASTPQNIID